MLLVALRTCEVAVSDTSKWTEHSVEATAEKLYGTVAAALVAFRDEARVAQIGNGQATLTVAVQPAVIERKVYKYAM